MEVTEAVKTNSRIHKIVLKVKMETLVEIQVEDKESRNQGSKTILKDKLVKVDLRELRTMPSKIKLPKARTRILQNVKEKGNNGIKVPKEDGAH